MIGKTLVGRDNELVRIREWLQLPGSRLVLITGVGGIGKTSLLQKIKDEYSNNNRFVVEYFDLAEQPVAMINQAVHLATSLGLENFPSFKRAIDDLVAHVDKLDQTYENQIDHAVDTCLQEVTVYLQVRGKRLLLITDTFEIAQKYDVYEDQRVKKTYEKLVKRIRDTCFIIAGRDKADDVSVVKDAYPLMQELFGAANILHIPLFGFNENEIQDFFAELDHHQMIPQEMREKLYLLTGGRPILLSLAVEWLQKNIPLPIMIEKNHEELRELVKSEDSRRKLLNSFEFELVSRVRQLETSLDIAILYMAQINRRTDAQMLSILLDMGMREAEDLMKSLLGLSFVKEFMGSIPPKCTLHDEMAVLVNKYAWEFLDINGEERKRLTEKVVEKYYLQRIGSIRQQKQDLLKLESQATLLQNVQSQESDWERWLLEAEALSYWLKISKEAGYAYFDKLYYDREDNEIRDQFLTDELQRAGVYDEEKIALRDADDLRRHGKNEEARQKCLAVLNMEKLSVANQIHASNTLGLIDLENAPLTAEENFQKALALTASLNDQNMQSIIHNNLGRLYRNMSRLDDSIKHFTQALVLSRHSGNQVLSSTIRNNLAWTYRLNGNLDQAEVLCQWSIAENLKSGKERPLAYAYLTKADIDRDKGDLQTGERFAKQAIDIFKRLNDEDGMAQAYRTLANISRQFHRFDQALDYLEEGIQLSGKVKSLSLLASLYQLYGRTIRHFASYIKDETKIWGKDFIPPIKKVSFSQALDALQKSIEISQETGNRWELARSQIEVALVKMLDDKAFDESELNNLLDQVWSIAIDLDEYYLMGYVCENRARIARQKGDYASAGRSFGEAAFYLAKRTGSETARAFTRLYNILLDPELSDVKHIALAQGMKDEIQKQDYKQYSKLIALMSLCEQILDLPINKDIHNED